MTGCEAHQTADGTHPALTTNQGVALADNQNSLGPICGGLRFLRSYAQRATQRRPDEFS